MMILSWSTCIFCVSLMLFTTKTYGQLCTTSDSPVKCEKPTTIVLTEIRRHNHRQKRTGSIIFPTNAAMGIIVAIAVPLDIPKRNVFVSYNVEGNYNHATSITDIIPGPLGPTRLDLINRAFKKNGETVDYEVIDGDSNNNTTNLEDDLNFTDDDIPQTTPTTPAEWESEDDDDVSINSGDGPSVERREIRNSLMSRSKMYKVLENKFAS